MKRAPAGLNKAAAYCRLPTACEACVTSSDYIIVLTTVPANAESLRFATTLVEERLAACVNVQPEMQSVYRWEGRVEQDLERQVVIKTTHDRLVALWERVRELHPYDVPEFLVLPVIDGSEAYFRWLKDSTAAAESAEG